MEKNSNNEPLVSVVMPVYNAGIFLKDAVNDVLHQTYGNFELICVDDGSTDQSPAVLRYFAEQDERIKIIRQENKGAGAARNVGMDAAQGEYLLFLDADDRFEDILLEKMIENAALSGADIVMCNGISFDTHSLDMDIEKFPNLLLGQSYLFGMKKFSFRDCNDWIFQVVSAYPWNKLFRADFVRKAGIRFQEIPYNNDTFFVWTATIKASLICIVDKILIAYRMDNDRPISGVMSRKSHPEHFFEMLINIRDELIKCGAYDLVWKSFAKATSVLIRSHITMINEDNYSIYLNYLNDEFISSLRLQDIPKAEYADKSVYEDTKCLYEKGSKAYISRLYSEALGALNFYFKSKGKKNVQKPFLNIPARPASNRLVLFGAGFRGQRVYDELLQTQAYSIVAWIDNNADNIANREEGVPIRHPECIRKLDYDYIMIAVDSVEIMKEMKQELLQLDVDEKKIIW